MGGQMEMSATSILEELLRIRPDFRACWDGTNYFRDDDGSFTACGVFSQFTGYFRDRFSDFTSEELSALADLIRQCEKEQFFTESAYTCFLENIAGDPPDSVLAPHLSAQAQEFMSHWRPA
jgi:hypothetical protein